MTALATSTDVESALGRTLTTAEADRVPQLVETASVAATVEAGGFLFTPGTYTATRRVRGGKVRLPATVASVQSVNQIECDGSATAVTDYTLRNSTLYGLTDGLVEVAFTTTAVVPAPVVAVVAGAVAGLLAQPAAGVTQELVGPYQVTFGNNSGRVFFSASDKAVLRSYRVPAAPINAL